MTAQIRSATVVAAAQPPVAWLEQIVDRAMDTICDNRDRIIGGSGRVQEAMDWCARAAYTQGRQTALLDCRTASEVASELNVHRSTVFRWSLEAGAGWRVGRDRLFLPEDVTRMLRGTARGPRQSSISAARCTVCGTTHEDSR